MLCDLLLTLRVPFQNRWRNKIAGGRGDNAGLPAE